MSIQLAFSFQYTSGHCPRQGHYPRYTKYKEIKQAKFLLLEELKKEVLFWTVDRYSSKAEHIHFQIQGLLTSLQRVILHRKMLYFILLLETGKFNYWPKREVWLHFHLICIVFLWHQWSEREKENGCLQDFGGIFFFSCSLICLFGMPSKWLLKKKILLVIQQLVSTTLCFFFEFTVYRWTSLVTDDHFYTWLFLWFCGFWIEFSSICLVIFVCSSNIFSLNNWKILFKCFSYSEKLIYFYVDWLGEGRHLLHDNHWL